MSVHPSICSSACLFSSLSIHQPVHWFIVNPCLHLLTCPVNPSSCTSMHKSWCTCVSVQPYLYLITCPFTYPSAYSCTIGFSFSPSDRLSISPVSVHLMSNLSVHCYCICLSFYHSVSCTFVGLAVSLSACLLILKAGMHNREAEMTVQSSSPEK